MGGRGTRSGEFARTRQIFSIEIYNRSWAVILSQRKVQSSKGKGLLEGASRTPKGPQRLFEDSKGIPSGFLVESVRIP